jgi:benzoyl-CoA reductase/2-hydroxyglutaryl-CoA dehydratase subunit BcrC/BadD/HgdB
MQLDIPTRREVIAAEKARGGRVAAVFPIYYPRELLRAHGFQPLEVWGPPGVDAAPAGAHLQAYTCSIVRNGLAFLMAGGLDAADVIVVPNACDSLQGLGSVLLDFVKPRVPVVPLYAPRATRPSDHEYLARELRAFGEKLVAAGGIEPDPGALREAIEREVEADAALAELHRRRRELPLTDAALYGLLRSRERLPAERFAALAHTALAAAGDGSARAGVPIVLSGIVPEPMSVFAALADMGAVVVADDLACCGRRLYPAGQSDDPYRRMAERLLGAPPDPMRGSPIRDRVRHLRRLVRESGARGVVFYDVKFCEPEQFDIPALREAFKAIDVPTMTLEVDLSEELSGQVVTRLEAFVEMVG